MELLSKNSQLLCEAVLYAIRRFPKLFADKLGKSFYRFVGATEDAFFESRSLLHLKKILIAQFFLQQRMEKLLYQEQVGREVFVRVFFCSSRLCVAVILSHQQQKEIFCYEQILKAVSAFVWGMKEIPGSFMTWRSPQSCSLFCYLELQKLRGRDLTILEMRRLQANLQEHFLQSIISCCPSIFWPYNHEESFRQLFSLQKEIQTKKDLPQVTIQFREQTPSDLEFLIHLVRPHSRVSLTKRMNKLPPSIRFLSHVCSLFRTSIPSDALIFSLYIPTRSLEAAQGVNLLQARKYVSTLLERIIGSFRDCNGGLFTEQEDALEKFKILLEQKIPGFSLFAEPLFYSLKPIEAQMILSTSQAEVLFTAFSSVMKEKKNFHISHQPLGTLIVKAKDVSLLKPFIQKVSALKHVIYSYLRLSDFHYLTLVDPSFKDALKIEKQLSATKTNRQQKKLRLVFQEGLPPSLHPHYTASGYQCYTVHKALFEGLTRLDARGHPILAGAKEMNCSPDAMTYTFTLRPHRWSNGENVTSSHYVESWKRIFQGADHVDVKPFALFKNAEKILKGHCSPRELGVYARTSHQLEIQLEYPDPHFLQRLSHPLFCPVYDGRREPLIFNGPYSVYSRDASALILERNPYFWNRDRVYFDTVNIAMISDPRVTVNLYEKGSIDWIGAPFGSIPVEAILTLENEQVLHRRASPLVFWLYLNTQCFPFSFKAFRQAFALSIDRDEINQNILIGQTIFTPLPLSLTLVRKRSPRYCEKDARRQFEIGLLETGLKRETFPSLQLRYFENPRIKMVAHFLKKTWEKTFGISVQLTCTDLHNFQNALEKGDFQIAGYNEAALHPDPFEFLEKFEPFNISKWVDSRFQERISQARMAKDSGQKNSLLKQAEKILVEEIPLIPISNVFQIYAHRPNFKGYVFDYSGKMDLSYAYF